MNKNQKLCLLIGFCVLSIPLFVKPVGNVNNAAGITSGMWKVESHPEQQSRAPKAGYLGDAGAVAGQEKPVNFVNAAQAQIGTTISYNPAYRILKYPDGDVPIESGVRTSLYAPYDPA